MQKRRQRKRLRLVDNVVATLNKALGRQGLSTKNLDRWNDEMPKEEEMLAKDKYTIFDRKEKKYRKGIHSQLDFWYTELKNIKTVTDFISKNCLNGRGLARG